jgi:hypothetical protein
MARLLSLLFRKHRPTLVAVLIMLGAGAAPLVSQEATLSPHGPLKSECRDCHGPEGWTPTRISRRFDHAAFHFPLQGAHATAACMSCHKTLTFTATPTSCAECHLDVHRGEFGPGCERCHTLRGFTDRSQVTRLHESLRFRLDGAHRGIECEECHRPVGQGGLQFVGTRVSCSACHEADFRTAAAGGHGQGVALTACEQCHQPRRWTIANFAGTPSDCVGCHRKDYDSPATLPNHAQVGFSTSCATCHVTSSWSAPYDHSRTAFPLTGAHRSVDCQACHADGVYQGKPITCVPCHQQDYAGTTTPNHSQMIPAWPMTCETCHTVTAGWPANLPPQYHNWFPVTHQGAGSRCTECHNTTVYTAYTCSNHHHPPACKYDPRSTSTDARGTQCGD